MKILIAYDGSSCADMAPRFDRRRFTRPLGAGPIHAWKRLAEGRD
jgi:hypothetical protein